MSEINLDNWKWLKKISGLNRGSVRYYTNLAHKNEVLMVQIHNQDAFNIYIPSQPEYIVELEGIYDKYGNPQIVAMPSKEQHRTEDGNG